MGKKMNTTHFYKGIKLQLCLLSLLFLSACSFAPDHVQPELDLPQTWADYQGTSTDLTTKWWQRFEDPTLNKVMDRTLANNYNLLIAAEQVTQARAYLGITRADLFPSISATGSRGSVMPSRLTNTVVDRTPDYNTLGLAASWELDFWGKYRNATKAAREQLLASEYGQQALVIEVTSATAVAYFTLLSLDEQLAVSMQTLATREEALRIYSERYKEGLINELDYLRASTEVDTVKTTIYMLNYQIDNAETALQVLMGQSPREIIEGIDSSVERSLQLTDLPTTPLLPEGIPSDLLIRRPDIQIAEANLRAANFQVGVAKAAWFPSISLTGLLGLESVALSDLFTGPANTWTYGASFTAPLFNAGKIYNNVKVAESEVREAALSYQQTVQEAFQDVRMALSVQESIGNVVKSLENTVEALTTSVELAQLRYDNGYAAYLEVLDAQRSLFDAQIQLANQRAQHLSTIVYICQALGGGWSVDTHAQNMSMGQMNPMAVNNPSLLNAKVGSN